MARGAWAGLVVSPAIGMLVGWIAIRMRPPGRPAQALMALSCLYSAIGLFAAAVACWHLVTGDAGRGQPGPGDNAALYVAGTVLSACRAVTFSGWVLLLFPMSMVSHVAIWSLASRREVHPSVSATGRN
jgi:hypothetical protein